MMRDGLRDDTLLVVADLDPEVRPSATASPPRLTWRHSQVLESP